MAEPTTAIPQGGDAPDLELEESGSSTVVSPETSDALDQLLAKKLKEKNGETDDDPPAPTETPEQKAEKEKKAAEEAAKAAANKPTETPEQKAEREKKEADEAAKAGAETPEQKAEREKKEAEAAAKVPKTVEQHLAELEKVQLPPHAKQKSAESFAQVKLLAKQAVEGLTSQLEETNKKLKEAEAKAETASTKTLSPEIETELKELRSFRQRMDVEADPSFKEWDKKIAGNEALIYAKLKSSNVGEDTIAKIKEVGGPAQVDWESVGDKIPAPLKRYIEGKLFENDDLAEKKNLAVAEAKKNADEFLKQRTDASSKQAEEFRANVKTAFETELLPRFDWMKPKEVTDKSTPEEKKAAEAHNGWLKKVQGDLDTAFQDDSPGMKAILVASYAQLMHSRGSLEAVRAEAAAKEKAFTAEKAELEKKLKDATDFVERIKKSSTTRMRESAAPAPGATTGAPKVDIHTSTHDALEAHRQALEAARAA